MFFEVAHDSHHQVAEVLSKEHPRLSVHGWFHGRPLSPRKECAEGDLLEKEDSSLPPPPPSTDLDVRILREEIAATLWAPCRN